MSEITISQLGPTDRTWLHDFFQEQWGGSTMVYGHGRQVFTCDELPGLAAWLDGEAIGLVTYAISNSGLQIISLDSLREGIGVGSALMQAVEKEAMENGISRVWLLTTNDNLNALRFYQKRSYELVAVHSKAVEKARAIKPSIPPFGNDGIPLRDELELEKQLLP